MTSARLKVISGRQQGDEIPLPDGKFLIGREEDCHLRPNSELVSRHHCVFAKDEYTLRLRDLGSTNGTFVNGERIKGGVVLNPGDQVSVGQLEFEVVIGEAEPGGSEAPQIGDVPGDVASEDTSTVAAQDTMTEIPAAPGQQPAAASGDTVYMPQQGQQMPGQMMPGYPPMQYPMYGYPGYPQAYPGYYPPQPQMPYPQQPGYPMPQPEQPTGAVDEAADASSVPEVRLPDPATTGAKPPEPKPESAGGEKKEETVPDSADKIIRQYLQRRPTSN